LRSAILTAATAISIVSGCSAAVRLNWEAFFPEWSPVAAVIKFRVACAEGEWDQAHACLSERTRKEMGPGELELLLLVDYRFDYEGHKVPLADFIENSRLLGVETDADGVVWVTMRHGNLLLDIKMVKEKGVWKVGLVDSLGFD